MNIIKLKEKASIATKWSTITEIAVRCVIPITNIILARVLTPEAFGVIATVTMITSFADIFTDAGFQKYLIQHDFKNKEELDRNTNVAFWTNLTISLFLWSLICFFSNSLAALLKIEGLANVIIISSLSLPLTSFSSIQMARYKRDFDFKSLFYIRLLTMTIPFFVTIPIAIVTHSFWALACGTLATNLANAIVLTWKSQWKPQLFYDINMLKEMFSYSWWILLESIANWLTSYIGTFIVGIYLSTYYVGIYKTSMSTVNQIISIITASTSMPLFAALSRVKDDDNVLFEVYQEFICAIAICVIPLGTGIWLYRDLITKILLGAQWIEATDFIGLWGIMSSFSLILGTYCNGLFNAKGKTYLSFIAQVLHLIVLIPILIWSSKEGYKTLYISRSLVRLEMIAVELIIMKSCLKFPLMNLFKKLFPPFICTCIMICVSIILQKISSFVVWDFFCIMICVFVYFGIMFLFFKKLLYQSMIAMGIKLKR